MRILHSVHDYLPQQVAGVEVYTSRLLAGQGRRDEVALVAARLDAASRSGEWRTSDDDGARIFEVVQNRDGWRFEQTWRDPRLEAAFRSVLDEFRPDILHVQHLLNLTLSLIDVAVERRIPIVMTLHDHWWACAHGGQRFHPDRTRCDRLDAATCGRCTWASVGPIRAGRSVLGRLRARHPLDAHEIREDDEIGSLEQADPLPGLDSSGALSSLRGRWARHAPTPFGRLRIERRWKAMRELARRIDLFLAPSRDLAEAAIEFGFPAERVRVLPHGLPIRTTRRTRPLPERAAHFGYLGSLVPHKGVHHLIAAFQSMPSHTTLDVHGSLSDAPRYVRELRAANRHPGVRLRGRVAPEAVPAVLASLDCLVAPSIWRENAPLGVQEAFVAGTPVIATDLGGHRELLEKGGGILVPPGDEQALLESLERMATEAGLAARLAGSAPRPRSMEAHLEDLREVYCAILTTRSPGASKSASTLDALWSLRKTLPHDR